MTSFWVPPAFMMQTSMFFRYSWFHTGLPPTAGSLSAEAFALWPLAKGWSPTPLGSRPS